MCGLHSLLPPLGVPCSLSHFILLGIHQPESEGPLKIVQPPHFTAEERGLQRRRGLCLPTRPVGAELGLEPEASEPARGFPVLQAVSCLLPYLVSSCLISLIRTQGWRGSTEMGSSNRLKNTLGLYRVSSETDTSLCPCPSPMPLPAPSHPSAGARGLPGQHLGMEGVSNSEHTAPLGVYSWNQEGRTGITLLE